MSHQMQTQSAMQPGIPLHPPGGQPTSRRPGIVVVLSDPGRSAEELADALVRLAGGTAFQLTDLVPAGGASGRWRASFELRAARGTVGDAQIYGLLRMLADELRWIEVQKQPAPAAAAFAHAG